MYNILVSQRVLEYPKKRGGSLRPSPVLEVAITPPLPNENVIRSVQLHLGGMTHAETNAHTVFDTSTPNVGFYVTAIAELPAFMKDRHGLDAGIVS